MKKLILMVSILLNFGAVKAQIADVQQKGSYHIVYDEKGKELSRISSSGKELLGVAGTFFVVQTGSYFITYDDRCKELARLSSNGKSVRGAAGNSFTVKNGSYIITYDKYCKEISRRSGK